MDLAILTELNAERAARRAVALATDLGTGTARLIRENEAVEGALGEAVTKALRSGKSGTVETEDGPVFLGVSVPPPRLVVIGAVHISQALAPMAEIAGYAVEIIDPRTAFATAGRFNGVSLLAEWPEEVLKQRPLDAYTAVAALSHDPKIDDLALHAALAAGCFYVGALGSRKTHARRVERLSVLGSTDAAIGRINAPIGLDIKASSPQEIAVAVLGAVIMAFRTRVGAAA